MNSRARRRRHFHRSIQKKAARPKKGESHGRWWAAKTCTKQMLAQRRGQERCITHYSWTLDDSPNNRDRRGKIVALGLIFTRRWRHYSFKLSHLMKSFFIAIALWASSSAHAETRTPNPDPTRFAQAIATFKKEDAQRESVEGTILFVGSSSIRRWDSLAKDFPEHATLNRGFGGSHISDVLHYFDILIPRHKPAVIVLYCGENDLWSGKPSQQVIEDFKVFVKRVGKMRRISLRVLQKKYLYQTTPLMSYAASSPSVISKINAKGLRKCSGY